nr:hypothetical protein [Patescibacteria group bacterium]
MKKEIKLFISLISFFYIIYKNTAVHIPKILQAKASDGRCPRCSLNF